MKKTILSLCETAVMAALALVLDLIAGSVLRITIAGGSLSIAMLPIFLISYRWGIKQGCLCGLITGAIQIIWGEGFINPIQVIMDYVLAYAVLGVSASGFYFAKKSKNIFIKSLFIILGIFIGCFLRFADATFTGVVYWETPFVGSMVYNLTYLLPSMIACMVLMVIMVNLLKKYLENGISD